MALTARKGFSWFSGTIGCLLILWWWKLHFFFYRIQEAAGLLFLPVATCHKPRIWWIFKSPHDSSGIYFWKMFSGSSWVWQKLKLTYSVRIACLSPRDKDVWYHLLLKALVSLLNLAQNYSDFDSVQISFILQRI